MTLHPLLEARQKLEMTGAEMAVRLGLVADHCRVVILNLVDNLEAGRDRRCHLCGGKVELVGGIVLHECWKADVA